MIRIFKGPDGLLIQTDLAQKSAIIRYSLDDGETWRATPFQAADAGCDADYLIELVDGWLESEGG